MDQQYWQPPVPPAPDGRVAGPGGRRRGIVIGVLGVLAGGAAGAVIATAVGAGATTSGTGTASDLVAAASGAPGNPGAAAPARGHGLPLTGTVTAVGKDSVTITTSSGTTTYAVTSSSDIDKNGEAQLSDLAVGDAVRFSTQTSNGATVIDKLHAGDEAKDMPAGPPPGG